MPLPPSSISLSSVLDDYTEYLNYGDGYGPKLEVTSSAFGDGDGASSDEDVLASFPNDPLGSVEDYYGMYQGLGRGMAVFPHIKLKIQE